MSLQSLSEWLRCPKCFGALVPAAELTLGCASGHRYDVNRRGYVSLLPAGSKIVGDGPRMLAERDALLGSGAYSPIASAVSAAVHEGAVHEGAVESQADGPSTPFRVLESGCGTGYYLHTALATLSSAGVAAAGLASDLSPAAVQMAVRGHDDVDGLVADVHAPLPIRDDTVDALLCVFAPRNPIEFARVVRAGGMLVIVVPRETHLAELRASREDMLDVPAGKAGQLVDELRPAFTLHSAKDLEYPLELDSSRVEQLIGMGPSAHHAFTHQVQATPDRQAPTSTTVAVDVLRFSRNEPAAG